MATKKKNDQHESILNKLGFDANDLIVDQNNQYNKILSENFTLGIVKYLLKSTKTWEEGYQLINPSSGMVFSCVSSGRGGGGICYRSFKSVYFLNYVHQYDLHFTARYIEALAVHMPTPQG